MNPLKTREWVHRFSLHLVQILWHGTILRIHTSKFPTLANINVIEAQNREVGHHQGTFKHAHHESNLTWCNLAHDDFNCSPVIYVGVHFLLGDGWMDFNRIWYGYYAMRQYLKFMFQFPIHANKIVTNDESREVGLWWSHYPRSSAQAHHEPTFTWPNFPLSRLISITAHLIPTEWLYAFS